MRSPASSAFGAIFINEVRLSTRRVTPYALMVLFTANAVLWWGWGPAVGLGWATNSDFYIHRNFGGFSFILGLPIFNAVIMGDPVIRDFRLGLDPLIFAKPIGRATYILGKFLGNFFVLVCCQAAFALTLLVLQFFSTPKMVVLPFRVVPYFKHFFVVVVISHLVLAVFYFAAGTLTRNAKVVYGLAACFYPLYIAYHKLLLQNLPDWRVLLDPLAFMAGTAPDPWRSSAAYLNQFVVTYSTVTIANRVLMIFVTAACLMIVYRRFSIADRSVKVEEFTALNLSTSGERLYYDALDFPPANFGRLEDYQPKQKALVEVVLPKVTRLTDGFRPNLTKLIAAVTVEFRLLRVERSLIVLAPLVIILSIFDIAFYQVVPEISYSATYASKSANALLLFLIGITVFYTGEAMHRDRELRIEPILWTTPAANYVVLLSKFLASLLLVLCLISTTGLVAFVIQVLRGDHPIEISAYLLTYTVILLPSAVFLAGISVALNVCLRSKHLAYAMSIGAAAGLFYLYSTGHNHWLYNPLLYHLWNYADLSSAGTTQATILIHRLYCLGIAGACLVLSHVLFARKSGSRCRILATDDHRNRRS